MAVTVVVVGSRLEAAFSGKMGKKQAASSNWPRVKRSAEGTSRRNATARYRRCVGEALPSKHLCLGSLTPHRLVLAHSLTHSSTHSLTHSLTHSPAARFLLDCDTLTQQSNHGMQALAARVLAWGPTPDCRHVSLSAGAENIDVDRVPSDVLYSRMCDLEALRVAVSESMAEVAETLIQRGFLVESVAEDETSQEP